MLVGTLTRYLVRGRRVMHETKIDKLSEKLLRKARQTCYNRDNDKIIAYLKKRLGLNVTDYGQNRGINGCGGIVLLSD